MVSPPFPAMVSPFFPARPVPAPAPLVAAVSMGYGHLRAAHALATALGTEVTEADRPPLASAEEQRLWAGSRRVYELTSRSSQIPLLGAPLRRLLDEVTAIPHLHPGRDLSAPDHSTRVLGRLVDRGLGRGLAERLRETGRPLVTTYFATAVAAEHHLPSDGAPPLYCVGTDTDLARVWVGREPASTGVRYLLPTRRALRRLRAYGVPEGQLELTGYPLPGELLGGPDLGALRGHLAARLRRLDPGGAFRDQYRHEIETFLGPIPDDGSQPLTVTYVVGGAGAQSGIARLLLGTLGRWIDDGCLRLVLVAGTRAAVAERFAGWVRDSGLAGHLGDAVEIVAEDGYDAYFRRFNQVLAGTDVLWTKPSELTFFGALGLPLVFTRPVGVQERYNRRWAVELGAGLRQRDPRVAGEWLEEWLADGTLAAAAWSGFLRLPKFGLHQILERLHADRNPGPPPSVGGEGGRPRRAVPDPTENA